MKMYQCKIHGETKAHSSGKFPRCGACNSERMRAKHQDLREKAIEYGGGKCSICGYAKCLAALEFHHLDESKKDFTPSRGYKRNWEILKQELDKCILVCANCHREIHEESRAAASI